MELYITGVEKDLGGFHIRRVLPYATHRMVGPFIFFDHMGPHTLKPGQELNVRPHPHIGLATVTYMFEGVARHRDSLGSDQLIEPGAINWMTAGRGVVHSERTPLEAIEQHRVQHGIQCWVALPEEYEETEPTFVHYPKDILPAFEIDGVKIKLLIGTAFGKKSPVKTHCELFYLEVKIPASKRLTFPSEGREAAAYLVSGKVRIEDREIAQYVMAVAKSGDDITIDALEDSQLMILGGATFAKRFIYWNFVASSKEKLEAAKGDWQNGPIAGTRFPPVPGDDKEFIPLPDEPNPKGTPM